MRRARVSPPHADSPHSKGRRLRNSYEWRVDQQVDRFRGHRLDDRNNLFDGVDPRRVEAVGASFRVSAEPADRLGDVGPVRTRIPLTYRIRAVPGLIGTWKYSRSSSISATRECGSRPQQAEPVGTSPCHVLTGTYATWSLMWAGSTDGPAT